MHCSHRSYGGSTISRPLNTLDRPLSLAYRRPINADGKSSRCPFESAAPAGKLFDYSYDYYYSIASLYRYPSPPATTGIVTLKFNFVNE